jgi:hypothetical protein
MDFSEIIGMATGAGGVVKGAGEAIDSLAKSVSSLQKLFKSKDGAAVSREARDELFDLLSKLDAIRGQHAALSQALAEMKEELVHMNEFKAEVEKHALKELAPHSWAYAPKEPTTADARGPYLCARCFGEHRKSILQFQSQDWHFDTLACPRCASTVRVPNDQKPTIYSAPRADRWSGY